MHGSRAMLFPDDDDDYVRKEVGGVGGGGGGGKGGVGTLSKRRIADGGSEV